jgi:hypothetical protein
MQRSVRWPNRVAAPSCGASCPTTRDARVRDVTVERRAGGRGYKTRRDGTGFCWSQLLARRPRDGSS